MIEVTQLAIYPVKGCRAIQLEAAELTESGLCFDRNWMVVDDKGVFMTQRNLPSLATLVPKLTPETLYLSGPAPEPLRISLSTPPGKRLRVKVWNDWCEAIDEGDTAAAWLSHALAPAGKAGLRLVRFAPDFLRPVAPDYLKGETASVAFADGYPFLLTNEASLQRLNRELLARSHLPVTMDRFRPNIVVRGLAAFAEDRLAGLVHESGAYRLDLRKPCQRCLVTTRNQHTGQTPEPKEPLRTLASLQTQPGKTGAFFGQNAILIHGEGERIRVGDRIKT